LGNQKKKQYLLLLLLLLLMLFSPQEKSSLRQIETEILYFSTNHKWTGLEI
jgi:hypothetical protein